MKCKITIIGLWAVVLVWAVIFFACGTGRDKPGIKPHILLITIDTLRGDHLGCYGYPRQTSPFVDGLAREGVMFKHVVTPQPLTAPSHASILTSLHPLTHSTVLNRDPMDTRVQTIAEKLKQSGYYTIGVVGVKILSREKNFAQGFDVFGGDWDSGKKGTWKHQRIAKMVNQDLFGKIEGYLSQCPDKPLFIWLHYYDPHTPYAERVKIRFKAPLPYPPGDKRRNDRKIDNYDKEIRYVDETIRAVYRFLEEKGLTGKLVTCITADHGEEFGEHGTMYYHSDFYSETSLVPLIFHGKGIEPGKVVDTYVSTMDIAVTLLARANLVFDAPTEGIDLSPYLKNTSKPLPKRKFLIIGTPQYTRSLQLLGEPYAYILNFDYHYRYWFLAFDSNLPENRLKSLAPKRITTGKNYTNVTLPYSRERGRKYVVFRVDIIKNNGLAVEVLVMPNLETGWVEISPKVKQMKLDVLYPVTVVDDVRIRLRLQKGTRLENFRYAYISKKDFPRRYGFLRKCRNGIFKRIRTQRKEKTHDEFFDLSADTAMQHNLVFAEKNKPIFIKYRKLIYGILKYYILRKNKLLKGRWELREMTPGEREMLKSLGYL